MPNSKLRKLCAVLCSGMCALGIANANPGKSDFIKSQKEEYLNRRRQESTEARNEARAYAPYAPFSLGLSFGKNVKSASAIGSLKALNDPKILEYFEKGDVENLEKIAKNKKSGSIAVYVLLRWIASLGAGVGVLFGAAIFIIVPALNGMEKRLEKVGKSIDSDTEEIIISVVASIIAYIACSSAAGGFNVLAQSLLGESKEVQDMGKELLAIIERAEKNVPKRKSKKRSKGATVKKGENNLTPAIGKKANQKPEVMNAKFDKAKSTDQKANVNVVGKNSNKAGKLNKSFGASPVAR